MKRMYFSLFVVPVLIIALAAGATAQSAIPLFRAGAWDHLYTVNAAEQASAQANLGYWPEGVESNVWNSPGGGRIPVFRLTRVVGGHLHHYYTSNVAEKNHLLSTGSTGYSLDGVVFFVYEQPVPGTHPIYRVDRTYREAQWFMWWLISPEVPADSVLTMRTSEKNAYLNIGYYLNSYFGSLIGYANPGSLGWN